MKEGYKRAELGWIPEEWETQKIGNVAHVIMGQSPVGDSYNSNNIGVPLLNGPTEFTANGPVARQWTEQPTRVCEVNDILFCVRGSSTGKMNIANDKYCIGRGLAAIRGKIKLLDTRFIYYILLNSLDYILSFSAGSTFPNVNRDDLNNLDIFIPPLQEQKKIAEILSAVDSQIDDTDKLIEKTKELKKGLMQRLLTKGIGHEEFKMTEIGEIPVEWEVKCIDEISSLINGRSFKPSDWRKDGIPIIRIKNLNGSEEFNYYDGEVEERYFIAKGQLLFSWSGSRGTSFGPHIWSGIKGVLNQHIFKVNINENSKIDINFIYYNLKNITERIEQEAHGSAGLVHITKGNLEKIKTSIPMLAEQVKIGKILSSVDTQIEECQNKKTKLAELKKGLMQQLLTGKIRVG